MHSQLPVPILDGHPDWINLYHEAWRIALDHVETPRQADWKPQMCCMPGTGIIWLWDSCFMSFFARYGGGYVPVMNNLDNLYRLQREDGFIGMAYIVETGKLAYGERINPPLAAWTEFNYWKLTGDDSRIREVLPRLIRFFDWIKANRRRRSGLYWFEDSGSTGMDNSPRSGYAAQHLDGSDICHVDLAAQQALAAGCIAAMAQHLGDAETASRFEKEHGDIRALLDLYHWNDKTGFYYDVFARNNPANSHNFVNHKTIASFWPMLAGCCRPGQVDALLEHLLDPEEFWTPHPVASLSRDDPNYDPSGGYWLGGVWPPINYMLAKALRRQGRPDISRKLAEMHIEAMTKVFKNTTPATIWEAYSPEFPQPSTKKLEMERDENGEFIPLSVKSPPRLSPNSCVKGDFVGWGGLGPIALLIEEILGLDFDATQGRITWDVQTEGRHGLENVSFAGGVVSLETSGIHSAERPAFHVTTDKPLTLCIRPGREATVEKSLQPGTHRFTI